MKLVYADGQLLMPSRDQGDGDYHFGKDGDIVFSPAWKGIEIVQIIEILGAVSRTVIESTE